MEYVIWQPETQGRYFSCTELKSVEQQIVIDSKRGRSFDREALSKGRFYMNPEFPKENKAPDSVWNLEKMTVISCQLKTFIEKNNSPNTEFIPVEIYDHKRKVTNLKYFIVFSPVIDCIDTEKSRIRWNKIDPNLISYCSKMVLQEDKLDEKPLFFRPKHMETTTLVQKGLADAISEQEFTGVWFEELDECDI